MIDITPLRHSDLAAVTALFNQTMAGLPYCWELDSQQFRQLALFDEAGPQAQLHVDSGGWLVAREGEFTWGFAHAAVGRLADAPRPTRHGFLRQLFLHPQAPADVAAALLTAVEAFFSAQEVTERCAFHIRSGYPCALAGRGMLPGSQFRVMAALGRAGYRISDRWLLYERSCTAPALERLPTLPGLSLQIERDAGGGVALYLAERSRPVAEAVVDQLPLLSAASSLISASLRWLRVEPAYRRKGAGRWLLLRALNELAGRGAHRLIVDINHADEAAQGLLLHLGFTELSLSGYSYRQGPRGRA
ncbi:MAG: GNAT family N-acetyltransferase [Caldilineales bacterium]|nr:GNAT family N-acetyltransferase [Caldilineales bacterium]